MPVSGSAGLKLLCGGEALPRDLAQALLTRCGEVWNLYGPTETTVWSTIERITSADGPLSIGRPIANTQVFVLDANRDLCPRAGGRSCASVAPAWRAATSVANN